ncbi:MAG: hemG [Bacillales bacterium]|jgi:oxygen-dependent protoporphyrinogen oxidase|nr:hemG [Bacillales bacterium]
MKNNQKRVVVIGGGITGLSAAYYLQKEAKEKGLPIETILIEASSRLGGKIQTITRDGFIIEKGPDSFLARKVSATKLIREVGLGDQIVHNSAGKSYVQVRGKLHRMPEGSFMGIPTQVTPFILSGLFSPVGKVRAALDFVLPRSGIEGDQSLGHFFRRRFGNEVVENLIEPLLSGIYAGDIDKMSLLATFPMFDKIEREHRSLVLGLRTVTPPKPKTQTPKEGSKKGIFISVGTGLQSLVQAIEENLEPNTVKKSVKVEKIVKKGEQYELTLNNDEVIIADSVIISTQHQSVPHLLPNIEEVQFFSEMPSTSVANVSMAFPLSAIEKDIDGTGFVVSRNSDYTITACTWTHKKWEHSTPEGYALLRCYVGKPGHEAIVEQTDEEIIKVCLDDLSKTMNITSKPEFTYVNRWKDAMPQYIVGHVDRMAKANNALASKMPGIYLAGGSFNGIGVPDCIDQAVATVAKVIDGLQVNNKELQEASR